MNNTKIPVDLDYVSTVRVSHYSYFIHNIVLNTSVCIAILLHSDSHPQNSIHNAFKTIDMIIEGEEYKKWGNDDSYITDLIAAKVASLFPKDAQPVLKEEPSA